ncbi:MAG: Lrp/AsnC family transcriptional regulator [Nanoarchaeota archaeon]|nr:Lrp/AsnC family transcriptional regulator [Nanoarchaeota archaeon]
MQLDALDKKILYELDRNSRQSLVQLAKKIRRSRTTVDFRIHRLKQGNVIRNFVTLMRPSTLGLTPYKIFLQLQSVTEEDVQKIASVIETLPSHWSAKVNGSWDFIIGVMTNNVKKFNILKMKILSDLGPHIVKRSISTTTEITHFGRDYLVGGKHKEVHQWVADFLPLNLTTTELQMLKLLSMNSRLTVKEISQETELDALTVVHKLKRFSKQGVIYMHNISLNLDTIGFSAFKVLVYFRYYTPKLRETFVSYCQTRPHLINLVECIGEWDVELDFELPRIEDLYQELRDLRSAFAGQIIHTDILLVEKEYGYTTIPATLSIE